VKSPKGFGKNYFRFAAILAYSVQTTLQAIFLRFDFFYKTYFFARRWWRTWRWPTHKTNSSSLLYLCKISSLSLQLLFCIKNKNRCCPLPLYPKMSLL